MKYTKTKELIHKIIDHESKKDKVELNVQPLTTSENILYILTKEYKNLKDVSLKEKYEFIIDNFTKDTVGYHEEKTNTLKIFLSNIEKIEEPTSKNLSYLKNILLITYHEYNHKLYHHQRRTSKHLTLKNFIYWLEENLQEKSGLYETNHEDFYFEIIAELYAYRKTTHLLKKHPFIYEELEADLKFHELYYEIFYKNYDPEIFLNYYINYSKEPLELTETKKIDKDLILDEDWEEFELETKYTILSSKAFLDRIDYEFLSKEELQIILTSLIYALNKEEEKEQHNQGFEETLKRYHQEFYPYRDSLEISEGLFLKKKQRNQRKIRYLELQIHEVNKNLHIRNQYKHLKINNKL